jgi:hypothetical protein
LFAALKAEKNRARYPRKQRIRVLRRGEHDKYHEFSLYAHIARSGSFNSALCYAPDLAAAMPKPDGGNAGPNK